MVLLTREQLEDRLAALHRTSLELVSNLSLETVLERIVMMAREQGGARYAALGVVNDEGDLEQFIPVGMTKEEIALMPHPPIGRGLLGIMRQERHVEAPPGVRVQQDGEEIPPAALGTVRTVRAAQNYRPAFQPVPACVPAVGTVQAIVINPVFAPFQPFHPDP